MMNCFRIAGGIPLSGEVVIQGSKNAALPIMAATILTDGVTVLHRCPRIKDVFLMQHLLESMGCRMRWEQDTLSIDTTGLPKELPEITPVAGGSRGWQHSRKVPCVPLLPYWERCLEDSVPVIWIIPEAVSSVNAPSICT